MERSAASEENINVIVRVRPLDPCDSSEQDNSSCLDVTSDHVSITVHREPDHTDKMFTFDHVTGDRTTQEEMFSLVGQPIIDSCMQGYNGTIFAYGQTGSGKTFTMIGPSDVTNLLANEKRGIIPRSFEYLFSLINKKKQEHGDLVYFECKCSFLEIYNEQIYDLLAPASTQDQKRHRNQKERGSEKVAKIGQGQGQGYSVSPRGLNIKQRTAQKTTKKSRNRAMAYTPHDDSKLIVYVDGLQETSVFSASEACEVLATGWFYRKKAATFMNKESSRSHAVFTLTIESKQKESSEGTVEKKSSVLNLVDLAGSERQKETQTEGDVLKEACNINTSLFTLSRVINSLTSIDHGKPTHVPFRESKLTYLLKNSLGGNAKTTLVANVHSCAQYSAETLSTLEFADGAKMIKNKAQVNKREYDNLSVDELKDKVRKLETQLQNSGAGERDLSSMASEDKVATEKKIQKLEEQVSALTAGLDTSTGELLSLQDEMVTLQERLTFKDLQISKLGEAVEREREQVVAQEKEVQSQLACEIERNTKLSSEMREVFRSREELVTENSKLKSEVEQLKAELGSQLALHKQELENTEETIASLMARQATDEAVIAELRTTNHGLREKSSLSEARAMSLSKEVEDANSKNTQATTKIDQLSANVQSLSSQLIEYESDLKYETAKKEEILGNLHGLDKVYQQLQEDFDRQAKSLVEAQSETERLQMKLTKKEEELTRLLSHQQERKASMSRRDIISLEEKLDQIEELKQRLLQADRVITKYETSQMKNNKELQSLKDKLTITEGLRDENKKLTSLVLSLQCKLSLTEDQLQSTSVDHQKQLEEALDRIGKQEAESRLLSGQRDEALDKGLELKEKCEEQTNFIGVLTQQIARYKLHEKSLFLEKRILYSQLEAIQEEHYKLSKECEKLARKNAAIISGHRVLREKVQYHATVKIENNKLKEEVVQVWPLKQKNKQVSQL